MIECFHISRCNLFVEHQSIALSKTPPPTLNVSNPVIGFALNEFPDGLSHFGWRYIEGIYRIVMQDYTWHRDCNFESCLIEHDFERVRKQRYSEQPSRLQSFFAVRSLGDLIYDWSWLMAKGASIYTVLAETVFEKDASYLMAFSASTGFKLTEQTPGYDKICKYWEGELSPSPQIELLLPPSEYIHINGIISRGDIHVLR